MKRSNTNQPKTFLYILFFSLTMHSFLSAQIEDQYISGIPEGIDLTSVKDDCDVSNTFSYVIQFKTGASVFIQFDEMPQSYQIQDQSGRQYSIQSAGSNEIMVSTVDVHKTLELYIENSCSEMVKVANISTSDKPLSNGIPVSDEMYSAIRYFQINGENGELGGFMDYVSDINEISDNEKLYFYQNFYLAREKIDESYRYRETEMLSFLMTPEEECLCAFILNNTQFVQPGLDWDNDGFIESEFISIPKTPLHGNSYNAYWVERYNQGPSKYHQLWTEGHKAGGTESQISLDGINQNVSKENSRISYNYFCQNYEQIPEDCQCGTTVKYYYQYDTEVSTYAAKNSGGIGNRSASAAADDIGVVALL